MTGVNQSWTATLLLFHLQLSNGIFCTDIDVIINQYDMRKSVLAVEFSIVSPPVFKWEFLDFSRCHIKPI
jgi:hypothetical protein